MTGISRESGYPKTSNLSANGLRVFTSSTSNALSCTSYVYSSVVVGYDLALGLWIDENEDGTCTYVDYFDGVDDWFDPLAAAMDELGSWDDGPISSPPEYLADDEALNMQHPFDCDGKPCPKGSDLMFNEQIQAMAKKLLAMANASPDNLEYGVFVFCNGDGTFRFSEPVAGEIPPGGVPGARTLNAMKFPPAGSVGCIHSHPSAFSAFQEPSGWDLQWSITNNTDIVIATRADLYVIPAGGHGGVPFRFPWTTPDFEQ